jgi:hypothetical protein
MLMSLMKPRRWLGYRIVVNDLLPDADEVITLFAESDIPLDDTFGSSSDPPSEPPPLVLFFGPGVAPVRLLEIIELLGPSRIRFLQAPLGDENRKAILVGAYNWDADPLTPFSERLVEQIRADGLTPEDLTSLVRAASKIRLVAPGG